MLPQYSKVTKCDFVPNGKTPAYSSDTSNNGRLGLVDRDPLFSITEKTPVFLIFGDHTKTMDIVHESFCVMDNVKVLSPKYKLSDEMLLYIITEWKKAIPNLGYARHWSVAKNTQISLPVTPDGSPDFDYMERYIKAIEKLTIADVVKYKNQVIATTKSLVDSSMR